MSEALIAAIAGEQAATYAYGLAAPYLSGSDNDLVRGGLVAHQQRVTALREQLASTPQPPAPLGFEAPPVNDESQARQLLAQVELRLCATYADLAAQSTGIARRAAVLTGRECAVRSISWGAAPEAFPGR